MSLWLDSSAPAEDACYDSVMRSAWPWSPTLLLFTCGCAADLSVPAEVNVSCASDADCPKGLQCHPRLGTCQQPGFELPAVTVAFVAPKDGAEDVTLVPTLVLVFNVDVDAASLDGRVSLVQLAGGAEGGNQTAVDIERHPTSLANTYELTVAAPLVPNAVHELRVAAGVAPADGERAVASSVDFVTRFATRADEDRTPPEPVTGLVVARIEPGRAELSWIQPSDADFSGVLIVRSVDGLAPQPQAGSLYPVGALIDGAPVVASTVASQWTDVDAASLGASDNGGDHYLVFAYDGAANYSSPAQAPALGGLELTWCTDESGTFTVSAASAAVQTAQQLRIATAPAVPLSSADMLFPLDPVTSGQSVPLPVGTQITVGQKYYVRPVLIGAAGTYIGLERELWASPVQLQVREQPVDIAVGGEATFKFETYGWSEQEAQVDTDPQVNIEAWQAVPSGQQTLGEVSAVASDIGQLRFRVRPVASCGGDAAWTVSQPFSTGSLLFVVPGGSGSGTGLDPHNAFASIQDAIDAAFGVTEIRVAAGSYSVPECSSGLYQAAVTMKQGVSLRGGWDPLFQGRLPADLSVLTSPCDYTLFVPAGVDSSSIVEGFSIENQCTTCPDSAAVYALQSGIVLRDNAVIGATATTALVNPQGVLAQAADLVLERNVIYGGEGEQVVGVSLADSSAVLRHNDVDAGSAGPGGGAASLGVKLYFSAAQLDANHINGGTSTDTSRAVYAQGGSVTLINNTCDGGSGSTGSFGVFVSGTEAIIVNNTISGGSGYWAKGVAFYGAITPDVVNNIIFATSDGQSSCVTYDDAVEQPASFSHNLMFDCAAALYEAPAAQYVEVCTGGALGVSGCASTLAVSEANLTVADFATVGFASPEDWHLTAGTPGTISRQGADSRPADPGLLWQIVDTDGDGIPRTCPDAQNDCLSIGAYELDSN